MDSTTFDFILNFDILYHLHSSSCLQWSGLSVSVHFTFVLAIYAVCVTSKTCPVLERVLTIATAFCEIDDIFTIIIFMKIWFCSRWRIDIESQRAHVFAKRSIFNFFASHQPSRPFLGCRKSHFFLDGRHLNSIFLSGWFCVRPSHLQSFMGRLCHAYVHNYMYCAWVYWACNRVCAHFCALGSFLLKKSHVACIYYTVWTMQQWSFAALHCSTLLFFFVT